MKLLVIGAGNGGAATAVELALAGHQVTLYARNEVTLAPYRDNGIGYDGVFGEGWIELAVYATDLSEAAKDAEAAIVALPTFAHASVARALAGIGWGDERPLILNPGHTGGGFEVETVLASEGAPLPPLAEFSTLAYVARKPTPDHVSITGRATNLRVSGLPGGEEAVALAIRLFPGVFDTGSALACGLSNVNMVLHTPAAMLSAAWVEATGGDYRFYIDAMHEGTLGIMRELDSERRAVGRALGQELPDLISEMRAIGTVDPDTADSDFGAISRGTANAKIKGPDSLEHRYYTEDFAHGLVPFLAYAACAGVETPVASSLVKLQSAMSKHLPRPAQRDAVAMGIAGLDAEGLRKRAGHL